MRNVLSFLLLMLLLGCTSKEGYSVKFGSAYWGQKQTGWIVEKKIEGAHTGSFEVLKRDVAKDKDRVYYQGRVMEGCSPDTLQVMGKNGFYCTDAKSVWISGRLVSDDSEHFELLDGTFSRDSSQVFFLSWKVELAQASDFESLPEKGPFGRDREHVFHGRKMLPDADPASFSPLDYNHSKDSQRAYWEATPLEGVDISTFQSHDHLWAHDKTSVYYRGKAVEGADGSTVEFLDGNYVKDSSSVFHTFKKVEGADAASFEVFRDKMVLGRDKSSIYSGANRVRARGT